MTDTIVVRGNVGASPQSPSSEGSFASFRIASTHSVYSGGQWEERNTTWYTVKCWQRLASNACASLSKGDPVIVVGRPQLRSWQSDDGKSGQDLEIFAESVGHDLSRGTAAFTRTGHKAGGAGSDGTAAEPETVPNWEAASGEDPPF
ncbi:single-stranded DNA-binding protein [Nesterenkonia sp. NBAIMH1]|uniref:single-stranded DNA-binding protein n=1 Tax=Nesterenkonia sp. NBAIMH1 TaxID=2600320 RepID=UPI0011B3E9CE|nr:single-stranded DNA-binding protein [Nesterenkonia sp. NBAIMH1]